MPGITAKQRRPTTWLKAFWQRAYEENVTGLAAMVAYNLMLAVFPFALLLLFVLGQVLKIHGVEESILNDLQRLFPNTESGTLSDVLGKIENNSTTIGIAAQVPSQDRRTDTALRPAVMGPSGGVSTGHPLTTATAFGILLKGGNAFDAGVAALIAGGVLEQDLYSLGGEALVLVYPKKENKVTSIVGQGWAPKAVDVDWYLSRDKSLQGAGLVYDSDLVKEYEETQNKARAVLRAVQLARGTSGGA